MAWIESHTALRNHRKVLVLARALRINTASVIGHLHLLWHAALEQQEDGDLSQWSDELIAELAGYQADAPQFVRLLQEAGWLDNKMIHDWWEYAGRFLQSKYGKNPEKWQRIKALYDYQQTTSRLPDIPNIPNIPNQTLAKAAASPALKAAFDKVCKEGLNIYALLNKLKKESKVGTQVPEEVLLRVCESYQTNKSHINKHWPWFCRAVAAEWEAWNSRQNEKDSEDRQAGARKPAAQAIKQILAGMK